MDPIAIEPWSDTLADTFAAFPDYIVHRLSLAGVGRVDAELTGNAPDVLWRYTSHGGGTAEVFATMPARMFRPALARWAAFGRSDPYAGHRLFAVRPQPAWPHQAMHGFSLFLCNEPTMGYWFKLYLYSIAGAWPTWRGLATAESIRSAAT